MLLKIRSDAFVAELIEQGTLPQVPEHRREEARVGVDAYVNVEVLRTTAQIPRPMWSIARRPSAGTRLG